MKTLQQLPDDYREICKLDLDTNKKIALNINLLGALITLVMAAAMNFIVPFSSLFEETVHIGGVILRLFVLAVLLIAYIVLHEFTHGIAMKLCGCQKISYGVSGTFAFAECREFFTKNAYFSIALAPVFLWGVIFTAVCWLVPSSWFWIFYILQIANIAGAAGDYYVTFRFLLLPDDILIYDMGTAMTVYSAQIKK